MDVLAAAKANDQTKLASSSQVWYRNGDEIATFLSQANPNNWPLNTMKAHMKEHLDILTQQATDELGGKYAASLANYDRGVNQILTLADALSDGIVKQFPDKF